MIVCETLHLIRTGHHRMSYISDGYNRGKWVIVCAVTVHALSRWDFFELLFHT